MPSYPISPRNKVKRLHKRASYDQDGVHAILDAQPLAHVGYTIDGQPYVTPTLQWREGNRVYWHGSSASRMLRNLKDGVPVCLTVSLMDGWVMARSAFHHSVNYRAAMLFGTAHMLEAPEEKEASLKRMMELYFPGRWDMLRPVTAKELKATMVLGMEIDQASAKLRAAPPSDDEEDYALPIWAGVLPITQIMGQPEDDPRLTPGIAVPTHIRALYERG